MFSDHIRHRNLGRLGSSLEDPDEADVAEHRSLSEAEIFDYGSGDGSAGFLFPASTAGIEQDPAMCGRPAHPDTAEDLTDQNAKSKLTRVI